MNKTTRMLKKLLLTSAVAGSLALAGCASTGSSLLPGSSSNSADSRLTQGNDAEFFSKSGFQACAGGAAVGVMGCMLSNSGNKTVCAVAAGIAACGVAMGSNYYLDQRRSEYASSEERLAVMSQDIQADTAKVVKRTETARQVMADDRARIVALQDKMESQTLERESAERELAGIDSNIEILRRDVSNMEKSVAEYQDVAAQERQAASPEEIQQVEQNIGQMNDRVLALQQEVDDLYQMRSAITLG
ncbi:MAG: hypothetical protein L0I84_03895 [Halomonas subglaciescola]|nr:hypothetical protein [Halomonas subglaciescola]